MNEFLQSQLNKVNNEVDTLLSTSPHVIRKYTTHLSKAKGKGIRALSVLVSAMDDEGNIHADAYRFASAIEILHLATLVHDDVMDDADSRRGIPTLHSLYGRKTAVIVGDYLLALAMHHMNQVENKDQYLELNMSEIILDVALGELTQHLNNGNQDLTMKEYLEIIRGKTAKLFEASFYAGAATYVEDTRELEMYQQFGEYIGMMFQINDDCLDFEASEEKALKPVQSDYEQGVMTLPLLYVFEQKPELRKEKLSRKLINKWVDQFGGVAYSKKQADDYYQKAQTILNELKITEDKKSQLEFILNRAHTL